jgi:hypothetical protein
MTDEQKTGKLPTSPKVQAASDALMRLRDHCDEVELEALKTLTAIRDAGDELMTLTPMMRAEYGAVEASLYRIAAVSGDARAIHAMASAIVRRLGMKLPEAPRYGDYELPETYPVKMRTKRRR